jgi:hypothetical protein
MEFTLIYEGPLKANGSIKHKHDIRRFFHSQLAVLWQQRPLSSIDDYLEKTPPPPRETILQEVGPFNFAPLINEKFSITAEIDILFLRPEEPGYIITQGGDIDNRLKTLFDAFRMVKDESEIPENDKPGQDENPFFCLLQDDSLITKITVKTDRLLRPLASNNDVLLVIKVKTMIVLATGLAMTFV